MDTYPFLTVLKNPIKKVLHTRCSEPLAQLQAKCDHVIRCGIGVESGAAATLAVGAFGISRHGRGSQELLGRVPRQTQPTHLLYRICPHCPSLE